jgi:serine/threonine protein kinase
MSIKYEQFGKYLLLEKVAAGGMAEIYLAKSAAANGLNKFVAIKRILPQFSNNEDFVSMFKEEAKVCINLNHSNVVSIFDFGIENGQFFLVMDFVEGRNLRQIINELKRSNKSFSIDQALYLAKEAAAGLDHAHRCVDSTSGKPLNITHRDMSPQNIMVSFEGEIKVIDFGIAKAETEAEDTKAGTLKGKFSYMSPEQAEGQPIDPRTDVFALGIVVWELLANDRLFTGSNEAAILRKVRDCQIPPIRKINPTVPQELERIVMKSLAKDRNIRYQTAANFHRDLNRFLNTQYPDFSPQDFSAFVKDAFKSSYQEAREKLVTYANLAMPDLNNPIASLNTAITQTSPALLKPTPGASAAFNEKEKLLVASKAATEKAAATESNSEKNQKEEPPQAPSGFEANKQQIKVNLDDLRAATTNPKNITSPYSNVKNIGASANNSNQNQTRVTQVSQVSYNRNSKKPELGDILFKVAFLSVLVVGSFWGYKTFIYKEKVPAQTAKTNGTNSTTTGSTNSPTTNSGVVETASFANSNVSIASVPEKAEIWINGSKQNALTPAVLQIPANKEVEIVLKAEGFNNYPIKRLFSKQVETLTATLQPKPIEYAYLNIKIAGADSFTKVSVNGTDLIERPPILKYPITANRETVISVFNPITKQMQEVKVRVKAGVTEDVELSLGKPSNK